MAVTTDKSAFLYSRQSDWQNVFRYLFLGSLIFLAACSNSRHNKDPEFDSDTAISVPEGTTATGYTATATDPNSKDTLTYSVSGGADQALLSIDAMTGVVSFVAAPDFENPADANGDNVYEVELTADDGRSGTASLSLQVTVTSNNQAPVFTSSGTASVPECATETRYTATASDANATDTLTFSVSGGADQARLTIDSVSGVLSFADAPEFAVPADANGDNDYEVQLSVSDGRSGTDTLDLVITVTEQSNFSLQVTYPTPSANLGGGVTQTTVSGHIVDSSGAPIVLADIDYVDVNGQLATLDLANPGQWSTQVPVTDGPNTIAFELGLTSGTKINSSQELQNFVAHVGFGSMDLDSANNRVFVIDAFVDGVIGVDLTSGARTLISGNGIGAGPTFNSPRDVALDSANNRALVVDYQRNA
ncbi:MAG TPA: hypothetical protein VLB27_11905, partial [candidate division Zixibacteria bacterium]|nr:hypothetical protein [candidate division Zixibacteria bacterium]